MRIALGGHAVGRPTRVRDAKRALDRRIEHRALQHLDLADGTHTTQMAAAVQHRDAGRIVAPVFQPA